MAILGLAITGFGLAFMLMFSAGPFQDRNSMNATENVDVDFGTMTGSLLRSFTTINGDFDVHMVWESGSGSLILFVVTVLVGNVVMLNLFVAGLKHAYVSFGTDRIMVTHTLSCRLPVSGTRVSSLTKAVRVMIVIYDTVVAIQAHCVSVRHLRPVHGEGRGGGGACHGWDVQGDPGSVGGQYAHHAPRRHYRGL